MRFVSSHLLIPALTLLLAVPAAAQGAETYQIDAVHSSVAFKIRHLVAKTAGRFAKFQGSIQLDAKDITKSSVSVKIDAASIDTGNAARDNHLKNPDYFDVAKFPEITFQSSAVKEVAKGQLEVTGAFTMHGVTRTITLPVTFAGVADGMKPGSKVAGFEVITKILRSDYGMKSMIGPLGDEVEIALNIEAGKGN